jgi:hypothetical protein
VFALLAVSLIAGLASQQVITVTVTVMAQSQSQSLKPGLFTRTGQACRATLYTGAAAFTAKAAGVATLHVAGFGQVGVTAGSLAAGAQAAIGNVAAGERL